MASLTEQVQEKVRALTSTVGMYNEDWHALFDLKTIPVGQWGERLLAYYNLTQSGAKTVSAAHNFYLQNPSAIV